jgi:hypothetical protein
MNSLNIQKKEMTQNIGKTERISRLAGVGEKWGKSS